MKNYLVVIKFGRFTYDVECMSSTPEAAGRRAEMSLRMARRNFEVKSQILSIKEIAR
jgi:hypothetical protein